MSTQLLYQIALTLVPNIGCVQAKVLTEKFGNAQDIFKARLHELSLVENMGEVRAACIKEFTGFNEVEEEIRFIEKYRIEPLFVTDERYPRRLLNCYDAPALLYYRGNADLNARNIVSIIGTRNNTDYGKLLTEKLVHDLKEQEVLIVSGLAFGIDAIAHKAALSNGLHTVGVLAHGLDTIYPAQHKGLAKEMMQQGGLLTELRRLTRPDKHNFPRRNRIVAGMADAVVVIETAAKGGSMITAELAGGYRKDVFAFPGRVGDAKSAGCNMLIKNNKAHLLGGAQDLLEKMGWAAKKKTSAPKQKELFIEMTADERALVNILGEKESVHIDELYFKSGLSSSSVAAAILNLELQGVMAGLPGKMYRLI
ncbi:DNA-processing protein DprA [Foetidibacter luteolus]|uniref:DNA-processing protein DprA n=1 Tax=Foetidibacter luteolus TaxID=2608880 RepID=UPI00129A3402|nr:DNA-processing protein DprA [Foetidibacter luteolus]